MVADCGARVVVADAATVTIARQAVAGLEEALRRCRRGAAPLDRRAPARRGGRARRARRDAVRRAAVRQPPARPGPGRRRPRALAVLLYTCGTSGRPARRDAQPPGAARQHRAGRRASSRRWSTGDDVVLGVLPLFHVYGLNAVLGQVLRQRARLVVVDGFDPEGSLDVIEDEAVTVLPVAPPVFAYWQAVHDLGDRLRRGAARSCRARRRCPPALVEEFTARTGITGAPGLRADRGRAGGHLDACSRARSKPGSVGAALPGVEIRLVDDAGPRPRGRGRGRDPGPRRRTSSAATGPTARTAPTRTAGTPPATSASSTPTATCSWSTGSRSWSSCPGSTSTRSRSRTSSPRSTGSPRPR